MNEKRMKFGIGIFVALSLVVLAALIVMFSSFPSLFTRHNRYVIELPSAAGVGPGTPVRRSGVRIGQVESVDLDDETGKVRLGIVVERKHPIRHDELPVLTRALLGETTIDFVTKKPDAGPPDTTPIEPGTVLEGRVQADAQTLLNQTTDLLPGTQEAVVELGKAAQSFNRMSPDLEETVRELRELSKTTRQLVPELRKTNDEAQIALRNWGKLGERLDVLVQTNQDKFVKTLQDLDDTLVRIGRAFSDENLRDLNITLKNVRTASDSFDSIAKNTDEFVKESRKTLDNFNNTLRETDRTLANVQKATKPLADRSDSITQNLDESTRKLNQTLTDAQDLMRAFSRSDGTLQKLMADPALYNNLNDAACMVARMLPRLDCILKDFQVFADKLARHPELLGVGGAVRPGSGIK